MLPVFTIRFWSNSQVSRLECGISLLSVSVLFQLVFTVIQLASLVSVYAVKVMA